MRKALIVEDDKTTRIILEKILTEIGWNFLSVATLEDAQDLMYVPHGSTSPEFSLILLDIHLPDGNGIDFLWDLRKWEEDQGLVGEDGIAIIVATGDEDLHLFHEAQVMGCVGYVLKPIQKDKLIAEIHKVANLQAAS
jgi:two-component system chemotaxis response regulator CheY